MVSKLLLFPFILMLIVDVYSLGFTSNTFGASGSLTVNQGNCTGGIGGSSCNNNNQVTNSQKINNCVKAGNNPWICSLTLWVGSLYQAAGCPNTQLTASCLLNVPSTIVSQTIYKVISISDNPFTDPLGFLGGLVLVLGIVMIFAVAIFGTEVLNAGTAYLMFMVASIGVIWLSLLNAGSSVFSTFPCYNFSTSQILYSCSTMSVPVAGTTVSIGLTIELILSFCVAIGTLDLIAI
jgi:hypothetical protein